MPHVYLRKIPSREIVETVEVPDTISEHNLERLTLGMLHRFNKSDDWEYFVDTEEADAAIEARTEAH